MKVPSADVAKTCKASLPNGMQVNSEKRSHSGVVLGLSGSALYRVSGPHDCTHRQGSPRNAEACAGHQVWEAQPLGQQGYWRSHSRCPIGCLSTAAVWAKGLSCLPGLRPCTLWVCLIPSLLVRFMGSHKKAASRAVWENKLRHKSMKKLHELSCLLLL